jgi:hypothetical protein
LAKEGIPVEHYVDSAARFALKKADMMLIGADAITVEGKVIKLVPLAGPYLPKLGDVVVAYCEDVLLSGWRLNLGLSLAQLGTKYLNQVYTVSREVKDAATGAVRVPADYSELGTLMITASVIRLVLPLLAVALARLFRLRSA